MPSRITAVARSSGIEKITTIGDDKNDIGMIVEFDGYALESAPKEVKNATLDGHVVASVRNLIDSIL
ncbi:MAG: HAD family hydrolase [Candidatus Saccharibacteria bacterium]|nr:HAD family hydrolase [Candidatus Saccharibacteria bacterium]